LAYSNFLTNNREKSVENFYDLIELDWENQDKYNFYIWAAYYRWGNHKESILILSQLLDSPEYKTDAYRYLLLNYQELEDEQKMVQIRQKLLWQDDLLESDFKSFYDIIFYEPFSTDSKYTIYNKYKQLSYDFVSVCYEDLWQKNDTCLCFIRFKQNIYTVRNIELFVFFQSQHYNDRRSYWIAYKRIGLNPDRPEIWFDYS
jgi:adenine-specific DNA methylase